MIIAGSERFHASHLLSADAGVVALQERRRHQAMSCGPRTGFAEMLNRRCQVLSGSSDRRCQVLSGSGDPKRPGIGDLFGFSHIVSSGNEATVSAAAFLYLQNPVCSKRDGPQGAVAVRSDTRNLARALLVALSSIEAPCCTDQLG